MKPTGASGGVAMWHRAYVGGRWEEIGRLTFAFMVGAGLRPHDVLLDIGCGALRCGVWLIKYLEPGHYLGIDAEASLIDAGRRHELSPGLASAKHPELRIDAGFGFEAFSRRPTVALAQSLFTHLAPQDIRLCLRMLAQVMDRGRLFATHRPRAGHVNGQHSDPHERFEYDATELGALAGPAWTLERIGQWGHPRRQEMLCFRR